MLFLILFNTIFLVVNHLYSTSASPILSEGGAAASESLNLTTRVSLARRNYVPYDQLCNEPTQWIARECYTQSGDRAWADICNPGTNVPYTKFGRCPQNKLCQNTIISGTVLIHTINCVDRPAGPNHLAPSEQSGVIVVNGASVAAQRVVSVQLQENLADASVSAFLEGSGDSEDFLVSANKAIVATLRGTTTKLCDYNVANRDCVPNSQHTLTTGDTIDFTFGLGAFQIVRFYYSILGGTAKRHEGAGTWD